MRVRAPQVAFFFRPDVLMCNFTRNFILAVKRSSFWPDHQTKFPGPPKNDENDENGENDENDENMMKKW